MSFSQVIANGGGSIAARLVIEAFPFEFVTHAEMETSTRVNGLIPDGLRFGNHIDVASGKVEGRSMTLEFAASEKVSLVLGRGPSFRTYMRASLTTSGTTVSVLSTSGLPSSGTVYVGTEAIGYTGTTGTSLTGALRGLFNSIPQAHYTADGGSLAYPVVTDWPLKLEGRRVYVYLYDAQNVASLAGDGELVARGSISEDAKYQEGKWLISVDSIVSTLKQQCTGGGGDEVGIRGILHPREWACRLADKNPSSRMLITYAGYWDSLEAWCATTQSLLAAKLAVAGVGATGATVRVQPEGPNTFSIVYFTGTSGTPYPWGPYISGQAGTEPWGELVAPQDDEVWFDSANDLASSRTALVINRTYTRTFSCIVPRAYHAFSPYFDPVDSDTTVAPLDHQSIYFDGSMVPQIGQVYSITAGNVKLTSMVRFVDAGTCRADVQSGFNFGSDGAPSRAFAVLIGGQARVKVGWLGPLGNFGNFIEYIQSSGPALCNLGKTPLLKAPATVATEDVEVSSGLVLLETVSRNLTSERMFHLTNDMTLEDILTPELLISGMHWSMTPTGGLTVKRFRFPVAGALVDRVIDESNIVGEIVYERQALGTLTQVKMPTGYDPGEDEYTGVPRVVRDVQASSANRQGRTMLIERKSTRIGTAEDAPLSDVVAVSAFWLGFFGREYWIARISVTTALFATRLGDTVSVTSTQFPNAAGGFGIVQKPGIVVGIDWQPSDGTGVLTIVLHDREVRGYAPAFRIASQTNVSGFIWDIVVNRTEVTDKPLSSLLPVNTLIRIRQRGVTSPILHSGTVNAVNDGTDTFRVTLTSTWTPSSLMWCLQPRQSDAHPLNHPILSYVFQGDGSARVALSTGSRASAEFAP